MRPRAESPGKSFTAETAPLPQQVLNEARAESPGKYVAGFSLMSTVGDASMRPGLNRPGNDHVGIDHL